MMRRSPAALMSEMTMWVSAMTVRSKWRAGRG
jgi:hypothetical protein